MGDVYAMSFFVKNICQENTEKMFYYYCFLGHCFFENIENLESLNKLEDEYRTELVNGQPPENLLDRTLLDLIVNNIGKTELFKVLTLNGDDILFINTWCLAMNHEDFNFEEGKLAWEKSLKHLNNIFNLDLKINFEIEKLPINIEKSFQSELLENKIFDKNEFEKTIFIFNYQPRSMPIDRCSYNNFIKNISLENKVMLSTYDSFFENNDNIKFFDIEFKVKPQPSCENILKLWDIAVLSKSIYLIPSGSSFTFFHKINTLHNKLFMYGSSHFCNLLNKSIEYLFGHKNFIKNL
jgi:hypothetical protein